MKTIILILSVFLATSCSNDDDNQTAQLTPVTFTEIGTGFTDLNDNIEQNLLITTETDWNTLLNYFPNYIVDGYINETNIDFNDYSIIAIISENQPSSGFSVNITSIEENDNLIIVYSEIQNSGSGYTGFFQPFQIVKIPVTNKPVEFE